MKKKFWTAALAGGMWTPLYEGHNWTPAQAVRFCQAELDKRDARLPTGEYEVAAIKAVSGRVVIMVQR